MIWDSFGAKQPYNIAVTELAPICIKYILGSNVETDTNLMANNVDNREEYLGFVFQGFWLTKLTKEHQKLFEH